VECVALNTAGLCSEEAHKAVRAIEDEMNLRCSDPIRDGAEKLLKSLRSKGEPSI